MARLRLGVALLLPSPVAEEVDGLRRAVCDPSLSRVPPHITLVPPVNVHQNDLPRALAVLRAAAAATTGPLTVTIGPPASFLPANPVLYLPVGEPVDALYALRRRVWEPPLTRSLAWPFVPHVTLTDGAAPEQLEAALTALVGYTVTTAIHRVHLLVEQRPGPHWHPLADVAFGRPAVVARGGPLAVELVRSHQIDPEGAALLQAEGAAVEAPAAPLLGPVVVTARREDKVVGVAAAWLTTEGRQSEVFVAAAHRGQGIGRHLSAAVSAAVNETGWTDATGLSPRHEGCREGL